MLVAYIVVKLKGSNDNHQLQQQPSITNGIILQTPSKKRSYLSSYKNFYFALKSKRGQKTISKIARISF